MTDELTERQAQQADQAQQSKPRRGIHLPTPRPRRRPVVDPDIGPNPEEEMEPDEAADTRKWILAQMRTRRRRR